jgi:hypothetical protein
MASLLLSDHAATAILSALWLAGFVAVWWLMRLRIQALEGRFLQLSQSIEALRRSNEPRAKVVSGEEGERDRGEEVSRIVSTLERLSDLSRDVEAGVGRLASRVDALESALGARVDRLGESLLARQLEASHGSATSDRGDPLEARLRAEFAARGFTVLRLMGDVAAVGDEPTRVPIEAVRQGVTYKGHVVLAGGRIVDEKLSSGTDVFP